ncbi:hypothetical protein EJP77_01080 [Paenibacillus zeisoli]|uniref:Sublancin immunity protein SunI-like PH domain-containing protein n=1 Tax=Paenibacillus zeisoli TaxID=2496267 RepID=A0A3S1B8X5_9BACL|nr:hypothetical protein [Paenibacillus zeisoli]RUT35645.1 hypothetical protein EJP77_01080 [Paenibacillus zeisoli]
MVGIDVKRIGDALVIHWQMSKIEIPLSEIKEVFYDNTYAGEGKDAVRIGTPYGTTDRVVISTHNRPYVLFTTNGVNLLNRINSYIEETNN